VEQLRAALEGQVGADLAVIPVAVARGPAFNILMAQAMFAIVGLIVLFAAAFVILNAFAMSIAARTKEIGSLRTLGMTRRNVMLTVLTEAGILGLSGAGLGIHWDEIDEDISVPALLSGAPAHFRT
jgi:putative ABC transport system permease protein